MKNHFREDGSCYHVAVYDSVSGNFLKGITHEGYSDDSMWARGQSWATGTEIDASIIYADYYYIEALTRLKRLEEGKAVV